MLDADIVSSAELLVRLIVLVMCTEAEVEKVRVASDVELEMLAVALGNDTVVSR